MRRKMSLTISKCLFSFLRYSSFLKYANYPNVDLIHNQILIKYDEERYLNQFVSEMFEFLQ